MKVLILGVSSPQMDAVLELKKMGCETYCVAMAKDGPAADIADHFDIINILDEEGIINYIKKNKIDACYSVGSDIAMPVASRISEILNLPHFVSYDTAYLCNHKNELRKALKDNCIGKIAYQSMTNIDKVNINFPVIIKPSDSQGQRGVYLINSQEELEKYFNISKSFSREGKVIVEEYIDGCEVSINAYMVNGNIKFFLASDRVTWNEYVGLIHKHVVPGLSFSTLAKEKMIKLVDESCKKLGILNGPVYLQVKVKNDDVYLIEITPRLDGCHMWNILNRCTGVNLIKLTIEHLLFNDIKELDKLNYDFDPMELVFWCRKPNTLMDISKLDLPSDALYYSYYYNNYDTIRPVNGKFEKIGYYIRKL